jgi:hypothetical protein
MEQQSKRSAFERIAALTGESDTIELQKYIRQVSELIMFNAPISSDRCFAMLLSKAEQLARYGFTINEIQKALVHYVDGIVDGAKVTP